MNLSCFILAAGESIRFDAPYPKQHIRIDGERLIDRTRRQFGLFSPRVVTRSASMSYGSWFWPEDNSSTAATTLSTKWLWPKEAGSVLILYSDVYYTDEAVLEIMRHAGDKRPNFFSDGQDIFAFSGRTEDAALESALATAAANANSDSGNSGRIWEVYRALYGIEAWPITKALKKPGIVFIGDRTQDFDTEADLADFVAGKSKNYIFTNGINGVQ